MRILAPAAMLALAGCEPPPGASNTANSAPAEQAEAADFDWTGKFAANPELCTGGAWNFGERRIVTDGETACEVRSATRDGGRVTLDLACAAEGTRSDESWALSPDGDKGLTVARTTRLGTTNVDLIRCG